MYMRRFVLVDVVNVLPDSIGCATVPELTNPLLWGNDVYKLAEFTLEQVPAITHMTGQGHRLILNQDTYLAHIGIDTVGEREIYDAINAAKGDSRFRAITSKRVKACPLSSCHYHC